MNVYCVLKVITAVRYGQSYYSKVCLLTGRTLTVKRKKTQQKKNAIHFFHILKQKFLFSVLFVFNLLINLCQSLCYNFATYRNCLFNSSINMHEALRKLHYFVNINHH